MLTEFFSAELRQPIKSIPNSSKEVILLVRKTDRKTDLQLPDGFTLGGKEKSVKKQKPKTKEKQERK